AAGGGPAHRLVRGSPRRCRAGRRLSVELTRARAARADALVGAAEVVLEPRDVVVAAVAAALDLAHAQRVGVVRVLDAVRAADGDVDGVPGAHGRLHAVEHERAQPADDEPVLGPLGVTLVAEAEPRPDDDALDLVVVLVRQDRVGAPGALGF